MKFLKWNACSQRQHLTSTKHLHTKQQCQFLAKSQASIMRWTNHTCIQESHLCPGLHVIWCTFVSELFLRAGLDYWCCLLVEDTSSLYCLYSSSQVMLKLSQRARGHIFNLVCISFLAIMRLPRNVHWINHQRYPPFQQLGPGVWFSKDPETLRAGKGFMSFEKRTPGH